MSEGQDSQPQAAAASGRLGQQGSADLYQRVTDQVIGMLDAGVVPWRSPILGRGGSTHPRNLESGKPYRGVNVFLLAVTAFMKGYDTPYWLTFNQAKERGGNVRKGERSSMVVFWKQYETTDRDTGEKKNVPVLRYYNVFNGDQCENVPLPEVGKFTPVEFNPIAAAETVVKGYQDGPVVKHGGTQAFYQPSTDIVKIPKPTRFETNEAYYATLFHELSHSTGAEKRLNRKFEANPQPFGSPDYGKEELIAEMSAAFLCGHTGIFPRVVENTASYISGWLGKLKQDKKLLVSAAGAAQRSSDWILGVKPELPETEQEHSGVKS